MDFEVEVGGFVGSPPLGRSSVGSGPGGRSPDPTSDPVGRKQSHRTSEEKGLGNGERRIGQTQGSPAKLRRQTLLNGRLGPLNRQVPTARS